MSPFIAIVILSVAVVSLSIATFMNTRSIIRLRKSLNQFISKF